MSAIDNSSYATMTCRLAIFATILTGCTTVDIGLNSDVDASSISPERVMTLLGDRETVWSSVSGSERRMLENAHGRDVDDCRTGLAANDCRRMTSGLTGALPIKLLMVGCSWDASPGNGQSTNCYRLSEAFLKAGNTPAAKAVILGAPGCHSFSEAGAPRDKCFSWYMGDTDLAHLLSPDETLALARSAYTYASDPYAANYLKAHGVNVNADAAWALYQQGRANDRQAVREHNAAMADARAASDARRDALLGALQSLPGANDPNAIINAVNGHPAVPTSTSVAYVGSSPTTASLNASSDAPAPTSTSSVREVTPNATTPLSTACVRVFSDPQHYGWLSFENDCEQPIHLTFMFHHQVGWALSGSLDLARGAHATTGQSTADINRAGGYELYSCPAGSAPVDLNGNPFTSNVAEFRCKST